MTYGNSTPGNNLLLPANLIRVLVTRPSLFSLCSPPTNNVNTVTVNADDDKGTKKTMARRAAPPGYMASPYGAPRARLPDPNESWAGRFYREQIIAPQYIAGNITILTSLALFAGGVFATRQWGEILTFGI